MFGMSACFLVGYFLDEIHEEDSLAAAILLILIFVYIISAVYVSGIVS